MRHLSSVLRSLALAGVLLAAACVSENSPIMRPGENCLSCHDGSVAPKWSAAGTVYPTLDAEVDAGIQGVAVTVTDSNDRSITMTSNAAGNFYSAEDLTPPFHVAVEKDDVRISGDSRPDSGGCSSCHSIPPTNEAAGRLYWSTDAFL